MLFTGGVAVPAWGSQGTIYRGRVLSVLRRQRWSFRALEMFSEISVPVPSLRMTRFFGEGLWSVSRGVMLSERV
ncbi:hypothetical protein A5906_17825 [Bradyrhizobium sacchari]|nr:hypothetical protein A5906_17825 [Bradyrhizobium sacchari]